MVEIACVIGDQKSGKSYTVKAEGSQFVGKKVREKVPGSVFGLVGYELEIRGGSDRSGFPMRPEIDSAGRKRPLVPKSKGVKITRKGMLKRKTMVGNHVSAQTAQLNLVVSKYGTKSIPELLGIEEKKEGKESKESPAKPEEKKA